MIGIACGEERHEERPPSAKDRRLPGRSKTIHCNL